MEEWVGKHENPDKSILFLGYDSYSPEQIFEEVKKDTGLGRELPGRLQNQARKYGIEILFH